MDILSAVTEDGLAVEKQGPMECALATMGALTGTSLATLREMAGPLYFGDHSQIVSIARHVGGEHLVALMGMGIASGIRRLSPFRREVPTWGRGTVRFNVRGCPTQAGHIVPWKNGFLYDPESPNEPLTLTQYRRRYRRLIVDYITWEDEA